MQPKIVERPAFHVVGLRERYQVGKPFGIPAQWDRFSHRRGEVEGAIPDVFYGVCVDDTTGTDRGFFYIAGMGVTSLDRVPEGMVGLTVPGGTFAVFTHKGPITSFSNTVQAIWKEWLPASGLKPTGAPDYELYDKRFRMESPDSEVDVYVPVARPH